MSHSLFRPLLRTLSAGPLLAAGALLAGTAGPARAAPILDAAGDFLPTYTGPHDAGLDVLTHEVTLAGDRLNFFGQMAGPISPTQAIGGVYLIGVDRGSGTPRFLNSPAAPPAIGPNVKWDAIVRVLPNGTAFYLNSLSGVTTALDPADLNISGNEFSVSVPVSLMLTSATLPPEQWTYNLWPRNGVGLNVQVSDLAPDDGNSPVHVVPEPASLALCGIGALGLFGRRRRNAISTRKMASVESLETRQHMDAVIGGDVSVVMSGLDCPRGLAFDPRGALYVAEAGRGGGVGAPSVVQRGSTFYYGPTGAISRLWQGQQSRVATGLPSLAMANGSRAEGPSDISFQGVGSAYIAIGLEGNPNLREQLGVVGAGFGRLDRMQPDGTLTSAADLAGYEATVNPDGRQLDSDPYSVLAQAGSQVVVDAGGNSLLRVAASGDISTLAVLPTLATSTSGDAVPTCVTLGPDGAYYVGILSGLPFADGAARIYRIVPGEAPAEFRTGFKAIIDIDFDDAGNLYVLQHSSGATGLALPGSLLRVAPDGTRTTVLAGLTNPTSVLVGPDHDLYVSEFGLSPGGGRVLRIAASNPLAPLVAAKSPFATSTADTIASILKEGDESLL